VTDAPSPDLRRTRTVTSGLVLGLAVSSLVLGACTPGSGPDVQAPSASSSGASGSAAPSTTSSAAAMSSPTSEPTPGPTEPPPWRSPLTGEVGEEGQPVLIVKMDNTRNAQPHAGLSKADVVYIEEVEYGMTRIAAVFSSEIPDRIGPVRSARITDIDLLAQYRRPAFSYSGAQRKMFPVLDSAPFVDVSPRRGDAGYSRDYARRAPYNYFIDGTVAIERAPKASAARDIGFTFSEDVPVGGRVATSARAAWPYSSAEFTYRPRKGTYSVDLNDEKAAAEESKEAQQASTVVIQYVKQEASRFFDKGGGNTPHAETIGSGRALVLRDGMGWKARWDRPSAKQGTTFTTAEGEPLPFKPGQVWVVLLDRDRKATVEPWTWPDTTSTSASPSASPSSTMVPQSSTEPSSASD